MPTSAPARRSGRIPAAEIAAHDAGLVEAAGRLFRKHGYTGTSIDMIARAAQVSPKTVYARYGGKLGLFQSVIKRMVSKPLDAWNGLDSRRDPAQVLAEAADRFLAVVLSKPIVAMERAIIAEASRLPELAQTFYALGPRRGLDQLASYFADLHARGRLRIEDPAKTAELFIGLVEGELVRRALFLGEVPSPESRRAWLDAALKVFLRAHALSNQAINPG